jgi:hypothetical protein
MTSVYKSPDDRRFSIDNVVECYGDLAELEWKFPVGSLIGDASHLPKGVLISSLIDEADYPPEEVIDGLESLARAAAILVNNGPDILWAFAKAAGISDEVTAILDEQDAPDNAIKEDPSLINVMPPQQPSSRFEDVRRLLQEWHDLRDEADAAQSEGEDEID